MTEKFNKKIFPKFTNFEKIAEVVSEVTGVTVAQMQGSGRKREYCYARHIYCYIARMVYQNGVTQTAAYLNKDHATCLHSCRTASDLMETLPSFREAYNVCLTDCIAKFGVYSEVSMTRIEAMKTLIKKKEDELQELRKQLTTIIGDFHEGVSETTRHSEHELSGVGDIS